MNQGEFLTVIVTSFILFLIFVRTFIEEYRFKRNGRIIEGTITKLDTDSDHSGMSPTVKYFDKETNSTHTFTSNASVTHFKKVGDKYKLRVFTNGSQRKHESLWALHLSSAINFMFFAITLWIIISFINPNNNMKITTGYVGFFLLIPLEAPFIFLSYLFYLNRKTSSY